MGDLANAEMALPGHFRLLCLLAMLVTTTGNEIFASVYAGITGYDGNDISCGSPNPAISVKHTLDQCNLVPLSLDGTTVQPDFYVKTSLSGSTYSTIFSDNNQCTASGTVNPNPVAAAIDTCSAVFTIGGSSYKEMFSNAYATDASQTFDCTSGVCVVPTPMPSSDPSSDPSSQPSSQPSSKPSSQPSSQPSSMPSAQPSAMPSVQPSAQPSSMPSAQPSSMPSSMPSAQPSSTPSAQPSSMPRAQPSSMPSGQPSSEPSKEPSSAPLREPTPHAAAFSVELAGVITFNTSDQNAFKPVVAGNAGNICGSNTTSPRPCVSSDVTITGVSRRTVSVSFTINVASEAAASSAVTTLSAYMTSTNFVVDLQSSGSSGLSAVTGTTVTSATTVDNTSSDGSSSHTTIIIIVCVVVGTVLLIVIIAAAFYCHSSKELEPKGQPAAEKQGEPAAEKQGEVAEVPMAPQPIVEDCYKNEAVSIGVAKIDQGASTSRGCTPCGPCADEQI